MGNLNIEKKIQDILNKNLLNAKRELLLFVNQTKETIQYKTDKQGYVKELLADYSKLSINKDGTINFIGRSYINRGCPVFSDEEVLAQMKHFYLCYVEKPMLGESGAIDAAEREGGLFLERWSKYNWLKELLAKMAEHQQVQGSTDTQSLPPEPQQMELKDLLPEKLKVDEAVRVFQRAIDAKLITYSPEGLKWKNTKQLLAFFATKVSEKFSLTIKLDKDGNNTTAWKPFETLFNEQDLKGAKQNWMRLNTKFEPTGFEKVDALF